MIISPSTTCFSNAQWTIILLFHPRPPTFCSSSISAIGIVHAGFTFSRLEVQLKAGDVAVVVMYACPLRPLCLAGNRTGPAKGFVSGGSTTPSRSFACLSPTAAFTLSVARNTFIPPPVTVLRNPRKPPLAFVCFVFAPWSWAAASPPLFFVISCSTYFVQISDYNLLGFCPLGVLPDVESVGVGGGTGALLCSPMRRSVMASCAFVGTPRKMELRNSKYFRILG